MFARQFAIMALSQNIHTFSNVVWQFVIITVVIGCSEPYLPVSEGVAGWMSDRALEIDLTLHGYAEVDCYSGRLALPERSEHEPWQDQIVRLRARGTPVFFERARVSPSFKPLERDRGRCHLPYHVRIESFATYLEIETLGGRVDGYQTAPFQHLDSQALRERPAYGDYLHDDIVSVGAIFGQMNSDELTTADEGYWSMRQFEAYWTAQGASCSWAFGLPGSCEGVLDGVTVHVHYVGPELFRLNATASAKRSWITFIAQRSKVMYVNGHAFQDGFDVLTDGSIAGLATRLVVLDVCWASLTMLPKMRRNIVHVPVDVVVAPTRIVTGSVTSFERLLDAVLVGVREPEAGLSWGELLWEMNELAAQRALSRHGKVDPTLRPPEIYGVARLGRTGEGSMPRP